MPTFKPFEQISEYDVTNLFTYTGTFPVNKGTFVKAAGSGFIPSANMELLGGLGASYANTVSTRWGNPAKVGPVTSSGDATLGFLRYDGKETDENGEKYIYNPRKAAEQEVFVSGQTCPIVRRGLVLYSGIGGTPTANAAAYLDSNGGLNTSGGGTTTATKVGQFLGAKDQWGCALVFIDV